MKTKNHKEYIVKEPGSKEWEDIWLTPEDAEELRGWKWSVREVPKIGKNEVMEIQY